jgi:hypothetical protein
MHAWLFHAYAYIIFVLLSIFYSKYDIKEPKIVNLVTALTMC